MSKARVVMLVVICFVLGVNGNSDLSYAQPSGTSDASDLVLGHKIVYVGPRQNISFEAPGDSGFCSFAIPVTNIISRSGQPTINEFCWLKDHGWKSVVDLRISNDAKIQGFNELHFNYLVLPIVDNTAPSDQQAQKFLKFVTNPINQPVHIHCHAGIGRTGVMIALYRYMVQGWPMDKAISESRLFGGGVNQIQENWLKIWAKTHRTGFSNK